MRTTGQSPRYDAATNALIRAFSSGTLVPGRTTHDAIGTMVHAATGSREGAWWKSLLAYRFDRMTPDDLAVLEELQTLTGYNPAELSIIEEAFDGTLAIEGRRVTLDHNLPVYQRLLYVMEQLAELEERPVDSPDLEPVLEE